VTREHYKDHTLWPNVEFYFYIKTAYKTLTAALFLCEQILLLTINAIFYNFNSILTHLISPLQQNTQLEFRGENMKFTGECSPNAVILNSVLINDCKSTQFHFWFCKYKLQPQEIYSFQVCPFQPHRQKEGNHTKSLKSSYHVTSEQ
jgi:hypothetical protein